MLDGKDRLKDKAKSIRQQVKDMPTQAQYAVHSGVNQIQENVSDFKRGIVEEKRPENRVVQKNRISTDRRLRKNVWNWIKRNKAQDQ